MKKLVCLIGVMMVLVGCKPPPQTLSVVGNTWLGYQPYYAEQVLHPEAIPANIHITMLTSDVSVVRMVANGAAQAAFLSLDNALSLQTRTDLKLCIAQVINSSHGADAIYAPPGFDINDRQQPWVVGMEDSALARYLLARWMRLHDIPERQVRREIILPNQHAIAYAAGATDIFVTYAPFSQKLASMGAEQIFSSREIPGEIIDTLVVKQESWRQHQAALKRLTGPVWDKALTAALDPQHPYYQALQTLSGINAEELRQSLASLSLYNSAASRTFLQQDYARVQQQVSEQLVASGIHQVITPLPICEGVL